MCADVFCQPAPTPTREEKMGRPAEAHQNVKTSTGMSLCFETCTMGSVSAFQQGLRISAGSQEKTTFLATRG